MNKEINTMYQHYTDNMIVISGNVNHKLSMWHLIILLIKDFFNEINYTKL